MTLLSEPDTSGYPPVGAYTGVEPDAAWAAEVRRLAEQRNATILDAQGRLAALSVGIPQFMLTSTLPVRFALQLLGPEEFREGDVFVANDPYHGGGHLPDYNVFAPIYADDPAAPVSLTSSAPLAPWAVQTVVLQAE